MDHFIIMLIIIIIFIFIFYLILFNNGWPFSELQLIFKGPF
jgi:thiosulfate reductase cytochrome b subunit